MPRPRKGDALRRHIFAACRELGIDDDGRRDIVANATGKQSMSGMGAADLQLVCDALREKGWKPKARKGRPLEATKDKRFVWVLWRKLALAGVVKGDAAALDAFVNNSKFWSKHGTTQTALRFISEERTQDVIEALKDVCRRNQVRIK